MDKYHTHYLNKTLMESLITFAHHGGVGKLASHLDHVRSCNAHKLKYWDLIKKTQGSEWAITKSGYDFLEGKLLVPERAITFKGRVVRLEGIPASCITVKSILWTRNNYARAAVKSDYGQARLFN